MTCENIKSDLVLVFLVIFTTLFSPLELTMNSQSAQVKLPREESPTAQDESLGMCFTAFLSIVLFRIMIPVLELCPLLDGENLWEAPAVIRG